MATVTIAKIKVRRGTELQRKQVIFDLGELAYVTDPASKRLFIGDGVTMGGIPAGMRFYSGDRVATPQVFQTAQVGDLVYDTIARGLFVLSGVDIFGWPDYSNVQAYQNISVQPDNETIQYNNDKRLSLITESIQAKHISSQAFDMDGGFLRDTAQSKIKINIDNASIQLNASKQMYVNPNSINWLLVPSTNPGSGTNRLWRDGNTLKVAI